ncbi:hypothetical protein JRQ81_010857 [Phrynocephalus forsythii]|uniref:BPTI/Kunitz inhibitor domain-containing protein n=1 Tax=Phrynocephalus forsythii TaxID=171643 RepID=A0A9Q1AR98_9SAUR|nr:hypothetical protein JRQ81_010857 [Phrynocephalus forsythii]
MCRRVAFLDLLSLLTCLELLTIPTRIIAGHPRECTLPSYKGPCKEDYIRYFYNSQSQECETFVYGGCLANGNIFVSLDDCEKVCKASRGSLIALTKPPHVISATVEALPTVCTLPPDKGPCQQHHPRYYYDLKKNKCVKFFYGGCLGNGNKFILAESCRKMCKFKSALPTVCSLPPDKGPCQQHHHRYYYDLKKNKCVKFIYGGCLGNGNKFVTSDSCRKMCKLKSGVKKPILEHQNQHTSELSASLLEPPNTPKEMTAELSASLLEPPKTPKETTAVCTLPSERGPCKEIHVFYYYNFQNKRCETFIYGGCFGNDNKFPTADTCQEICGASTGLSTPLPVDPTGFAVTRAVLPEACTLPSRKGPCQEDSTRYYYNVKSQSCETFLYGGCLGNENNFFTKESCKQMCEVSTGFSHSSLDNQRPPTLSVDQNYLPIICTMTPEKGSCHGQHTRYYYNTESNNCEMFIYGGCLGNGNRFDNIQECLQRCKRTKAMPIICQISKNPGRCSQRLIRYYYNQATGRCETFEYSGCGGNANHFHSKEECQNICSVL